MQCNDYYSSRIWKMKGGKYAKTLAKIQVIGMFRMRDIRRMFYPNQIYRFRHLYGDAILVLIRMSSNMVDGNQQKHLLSSFATKA